MIPLNTSSSFASSFVDLALNARENVNLGVLALLVFAVCGVLGNSLVCLAICTERALQTVTNYFLCSLAVADLLVSSVVMPLAIINQLNNGMWKYGVTLCIAFTSLDVFLCSASIVHMAVISLDRYRGISRPFHARKKSKTMMVLKILAVWALTFLATVPMTTMAFIDPANVYNGENCQINNRQFQIYGTIGTFFVPCTTMIIAYGLTVVLLRRQAHLYHNSSRATSRRGSSTSPMTEAKIRRSVSRRCRFDSRVSLTNDSYIGAGRDLQMNGTAKGSKHSAGARTRCVIPLLNKNGILSRRSHNIASDVGSIQIIPQTNDDKRLSTNSSICQNSDASQQASPNSLRKRSNKQLLPMKKAAATLLHFAKRSNAEQTIATEQKATNVLGVVFFSFILCWAPFFITNITLAICQTKCLRNFPDYLGTAFLWLGYASSSLNPLIYTTFNKIFRQSFTRILKCQICYTRRGSRGSRDVYSTSMRSNVSNCARTNPALMSVFYSNFNSDNNSNNNNNNISMSYVKPGTENSHSPEMNSTGVRSITPIKSPHKRSHDIRWEADRPRLHSLGNNPKSAIVNKVSKTSKDHAFQRSEKVKAESATFAKPNDRTSETSLHRSHDLMNSLVPQKLGFSNDPDSSLSGISRSCQPIKRSKSTFDKTVKPLTRSAYSALCYAGSDSSCSSNSSEIVLSHSSQVEYSTFPNDTDSLHLLVSGQRKRGILTKIKRSASSVTSVQPKIDSPGICRNFSLCRHNLVNAELAHLFNPQFYQHWKSSDNFITPPSTNQDLSLYYNSTDTFFTPSTRQSNSLKATPPSTFHDSKTPLHLLNPTYFSLETASDFSLNISSNSNVDVPIPIDSRNRPMISEVERTSAAYISASIDAV